jgi:hypothetical protein
MNTEGGGELGARSSDDAGAGNTRQTKRCRCGDRTRPNINHRVRIPCWTYAGPNRYDVDVWGRLVRPA